MKQLLQLIFRRPGSFRSLLICTTATLAVAFTTQCEVCALGFLGDQEVDLFRFFHISPEEGLTLQEIQRQWPEIAPSGILHKAEALQWAAQGEGENPLKWLLSQIRQTLQWDLSLPFMVGVLIFLAASKSLSGFVQRYSMTVASVRHAAWLRQRAFHHMQKISLQAVDEGLSGGWSMRIVNDAMAVSQSWAGLLHNYIQAPLILITSFLICWHLSWQLSLLVFVGSPFIFLPVLWLARKMKRAHGDVLQGQEQLSGSLVEWLQGLTTIRAMNLEEYSQHRYALQNNSLVHMEQRAAYFGLLGRPILHTVATIYIAGVVLVGLWGLHLSFGTLIIFCGMLYLFYEPIKRFAEEDQNVQKGAAAAARLEELFAIPEAVENASCDIHPLERGIRLHQVEFSYQPERPVLKKISLEIPKGKMVAVVGSTGAGKSTLAHLLLGLYEPQTGVLYWDDHRIQGADWGLLRKYIAYVPQRPFLFNTTIRENISFGEKVSDETLEWAARTAQAHEFITMLPQGYETLVGEQGKALSGGQLQRLAIARALLHGGAVMILDEITSALDSVSESAIRRSLDLLKGQQTLFVIAHRLSTILHADHIIVLSEGSIIAQGTLEELLQTSTHFQALWQAHQLDQTREETTPSLSSL